MNHSYFYNPNNKNQIFPAMITKLLFTNLLHLLAFLVANFMKTKCEDLVLVTFLYLFTHNLIQASNITPRIKSLKAAPDKHFIGGLLFRRFHSTRPNFGIKDKSNVLRCSNNQSNEKLILCKYRKCCYKLRTGNFAFSFNVPPEIQIFPHYLHKFRKKIGRKKNYN